MSPAHLITQKRTAPDARIVRVHGGCSPLLHPKTRQPAPRGHGPDSQSLFPVASVNRAVSPTAQTQPRDSGASPVSSSQRSAGDDFNII